MATIGLRDVHYALLTEDSAETKKATYEQPVHVVGAISANINPNTSSATLLRMMVHTMPLLQWVKSLLS